MGLNLTLPAVPGLALVPAPQGGSPWTVPSLGPGEAQALPGLPSTKREKKESGPTPLPRCLPVGNCEAMAVEEVCGLLAVSEQQHAHHTIQGEDGGALCACCVRHIERSERVLADLKREAKSLSHSRSGAQGHRALSSVQFSCSVVSDCLGPHEPQHARPPCPSPAPRVHPNSCPLSQ